MGAARAPAKSGEAWKPSSNGSYSAVEEARARLRVSLQVCAPAYALQLLRVPCSPTAQVAQEAAADGLLDADELAATVAELRAEYGVALSALGLETSQVPDPGLDTPPPPRHAAAGGGTFTARTRSCARSVRAVPPAPPASFSALWFRTAQNGG
jgi:hypothetical protein